jgi:hypothetical protein
MKFYSLMGYTEFYCSLFLLPLYSVFHIGTVYVSITFLLSIFLSSVLFSFSNISYSPFLFRVVPSIGVDLLVPLASRGEGGFSNFLLYTPQVCHCDEDLAKCEISSRRLVVACSMYSVTRRHYPVTLFSSVGAVF